MSKRIDFDSTPADCSKCEMLFEITAGKHKIHIAGEFDIDILIHFDGIPHDRYETDLDGKLSIQWPKFINPKYITLYAIGTHGQMQKIIFSTPKVEQPIKIYSLAEKRLIESQAG